MHSPHLRIAIFALIGAASLFAETPCSRTIPVTVVVQDGTIVNDLPPDSLLLRSKASQSQPELKPDSSHRRIAIVLDRSSSLRPEVLQAEQWMAKTIVQNAREGDSFSVISGNGVPVRAAFSEGSAAVLKAIESLGDRSQAGRKISLFDAVAETLSDFGEPQFGDAIILFASQTMSLSDGSIGGGGMIADAHLQTVDGKTKGTSLQNALLSRSTRIFGVSLGPLDLGTMDSFLTVMGRSSSLKSSTLFNANPSNLDSFSLNTGGFAFVHPDMGEGWKSFKFDESSKKKLAAEAMKFYGAIAQTYRVRVNYVAVKQTPLSLDLKPEIAKQLPPALALYPRALPACIAK